MKTFQLTDTEFATHRLTPRLVGREGKTDCVGRRNKFDFGHIEFETCTQLKMSSG